MASCRAGGADAGTQWWQAALMLPSQCIDGYGNGEAAREATSMLLGRIARALALTVAICCPALADGAATPIGGWNGTYSCFQGETALHLDITKGPGGRVAAVFSFSSVPSNASVPNGSFEMAGTFDPSTDHLALSPGGWLAHPPGYVTVGLDGTLACSGSHLVGQVTGGAFCKSFDLVRDGSPAVPCGPALVASR